MVKFRPQRSALLSLVAGFLVSRGFVEGGSWIWIFLGLGIFSRSLCTQSFRYRCVAIYLFAFSFLLFLLSWSSIYVGTLPWLLLCFGEAFFYLPLALVRYQSAMSYPLLFASALVFCEFLRRQFPFGGFGWGRIGFASTHSPFSAALPIGGVAAGTFILACTSAYTFHLFSFFTVRGAITTVLLFLLSAGLNVFYKISDSDSMIKVALIQGGVPQLGLAFNDNPSDVFSRQFNQTVKLIKTNQVQLVVWPENTVLIENGESSPDLRTLHKLSGALKTPILVGAVEIRDGHIYNESLLITDSSTLTYSKRKLVPFGEFIPLREISTLISPLASRVHDFTPGTHRTVFAVADKKFSSLLCFEILDDAILRDAALHDQFIVVQSNNATFGRSAELFQERQIAQARARESGRTIGYDSTTGITSIIDNNGKILAEAQPFASETLISDLEISSKVTPSMKYGGVIELLIIACFSWGMVRRWVKK